MTVEAERDADRDINREADRNTDLDLLAYYELRRGTMGLDQLAPYDMFLQLISDPGLRYNYTDALQDVYGSCSSMDPAFRAILIKTVTGNYIDVYPDPEGGKAVRPLLRGPLCKKAPGTDIF